jgi:hypothetical protein
MYTETATSSTAAATDDTPDNIDVTTTAGESTAADTTTGTTSTSNPDLDTTSPGEAPSTGTTSGTTDTTDTPDSDTSSGGPGLACEPEAADPIAVTGITWAPFPEVVDGKIDFSAECMPLGTIEGSPHLMELQCGATKASIIAYMDASELIDLPDHPLQLTYVHRAAGFFASEWFTLVDPADDPPTPLIAGIRSNTITPPDLPDFFAPFGVEALADVCTAPPVCPYPFERLGARFTHGANELVLTDNTSGALGDDYRVLLGVAHRYLERFDLASPDCPHFTDAAPQYFTGLILRVP